MVAWLLMLYPVDVVTICKLFHFAILPSFVFKVSNDEGAVLFRTPAGFESLVWPAAAPSSLWFNYIRYIIKSTIGNPWRVRPGVSLTLKGF